MYIWMRDLKSEFPKRRFRIRQKKHGSGCKRWMKKKHPSFDGDVYVENVRCLLEFPEEEREKRECTVNGEKITALI